MPIRPFLKDRVFEPELVREMGEAFETVCDYLKLDRLIQDDTTRYVAEIIIGAAETGHSDCASMLGVTFDELGIIRTEKPHAA